MIINTNLFGLSINIAFVSITRKEQKEGKVPRWKKKLKEKDEVRPSRKAVWRPKNVKPQETGDKMLARRLVSSKDYNI